MQAAARDKLRQAGPPRVQAALSLLRRGLLAVSVIDAARAGLRRRACTEAQARCDTAWRSGDLAAIRAARRDRALVVSWVPDEITIARYLADSMPSRPRGGRNERAMAAHQIEAETRRLERLDAWFRDFYSARLRAERDLLKLATDAHAAAVAGWIEVARAQWISRWSLGRER